MISLLYEQNKTIGNGHLMRCSSVQIALSIDWDLPSDLINESAFTYKGEKGNIYVLDIFDIEKCSSLINLLAKDNLILTFDYFSNVAQPDLNISVLEQFDGQRSYPNYVGLQYCIVRNDFFKHPIVENKSKNIFVYIGGSGYKELVYSIAAKLANSNYIVDLVRNQNSDALEKLPNNFKVHYLPENLIDLMNNSEFAITSPGLATMELLYLQVPSVLCPLNTLHERFTDYFIKNDYAICRFSDFKHIDTERFQLVRYKIKNVIDGKGLDRIIQLIFQHYEQKMGRSYSLRK